MFLTSPSLIPKGSFARKFYHGFSYWVILMEEIMHKYYTKEVYRLFFYIIIICLYIYICILFIVYTHNYISIDAHIQ